MSSNDDSSAGGEASADYIISQSKNKEAGKEGNTKTTETKTTTTTEGTGGKLGAGSATSAEDPTNKWINDPGGKVTKVEGAGETLGSGDDATNTTQRPKYQQHQEVQSE